jgi:hypothetical protein
MRFLISGLRVAVRSEDIRKHMGKKCTEEETRRYERAGICRIG